MRGRRAPASEAARPRRGIRQAAWLAACLLLSPGTGQAALLGSCAIVVGAPGSLKPDATIRTLASSNPGGSTAKATVVTTGPTGVILPQLLCTLQLLINCYAVSVVPPTSFATSPTGGNTGVSFASSFTIQGTSGLLSSILLVGTYPIEVDLTATRSGTMFPVGTYTAISTVRCE